MDPLLKMASSFPARNLSSAQYSVKNIVPLLHEPFPSQTQEAERMIEKMEQDEDVLIERLKKVQEEQRKAYELLQESLES